MSNQLSPSFAFEVGNYFRHGTTVFRISAEHLGLLTLEHMATGEQKVIREVSLYGPYNDGELVAATVEDVARATNKDLFLEDEVTITLPPLPSLSKATIEDGRAKLKYIRALRDLGYHCLRPTPLLKLDMERLAQKYQDPDPPKLSTIYTASLKFDAAGGDARAIFPRFSDRGGRNKIRFTPLALAEFKKACEQLREDDEKKIRPREVHAKIFVSISASSNRERAIDETPSESAIKRQLVAEFGQQEIDLRNRGPAFVKKQYRTWNHRDGAIFPLEVIEFDDKDTRVFLVDDETGLPCGRAYVTAGIDQGTGVVLGTASDDLPRSLLSAKEALVNAVLPFDPRDWRLSEVKDLPPTFGQFGIAVFDNALYNHAADLEATAYELAPHSTVTWSKPRTPTGKSTIENFNGRMVEFLATLPGWGGPKGTVEGLQHAASCAILGEQDFTRHFHKWCFDEYGNTPGEDGYTPRERWHKGTEHARPKLPADAKKMRLLLMVAKTVRLRPEGVSLGPWLTYRNPRLDVIQKKLGHNSKVAFRYNPKNLESIFVLDPDSGFYFQVGSTSPKVTYGLNLYQYKLIRKMAATKKRYHPSLAEMIDAKEALATLTKQLRISTKRKERLIGKRASSAAASSDTPKIAAPSVEIVSELEATVEDLSVVTLEDTGDWDCDLSFE